MIFCGCAADINQTSELKQSVLWQGGADGYETYRIPALIAVDTKRVLAFCEGRVGGFADSGNIDIVYKVSDDSGKSWSVQKVLVDDGNNCCGNPAPVYDEKTKTLFLMYTWNHGGDKESAIKKRKSRDTRRVFVISSTDFGNTWTVPREITSEVKRADWTWYATGPGAGIQLGKGAHAGRLVVPCDHFDFAENLFHSHIVYSDDHGASWHIGGIAQSGTNECQVAELSDGSLLLNMRNFETKIKTRQRAKSTDGGTTWIALSPDSILIEPVCQASLRSSLNIFSKRFLFFSNPASEKRENMTLRISFDDGQSWPVSVLMCKGPSAYSAIEITKNKTVLCLYESGTFTLFPYKKIYIAVYRSETLK